MRGDFLDFKKFESRKSRSHKNLMGLDVLARGVNPGGDGGDTSPQFLDWGGRISNCPPQFFLCSMKFNSALFNVYCGHCLSLSICIFAAERQRGSTLFLTLHEVLAFSCPVPGRVIFSRYLDFCGGDVSKSGGKLSIQVGF